MPNLPKPRLRRTTRVDGDAGAATTPEQARQPNIEIVAGEGLRWVNIERPTAARARLAGGGVRLPRPRPRGRLLAQPAAEDRRVRRLPLHRPALPGLRQRRRAAGHRRARPLRRPRLPRHDPQPAAAAGRVPVRALPRQGGAPRPALLAGLRATCSTASSTTPSTTASRCCARSATSSTRWRRTSSRAAPRRSSATSPTSSRRSSTSAR